MNKTMLKVAIAGSAMAAMINLGVNSVRADQQLSARFNMPIHVACNINETGCDNSPGPQITIDGAIALGGMQVNLVLANNVKKTHEVQVTYSTNVYLVALDAPITLPKQPVLGGVGGNPHIWIQFFDSKGNNMTDELYLGRCVQGMTLDQDFLNDTLASTLVSAGGCNNHPGPVITFGGQLTLSGLNARFIFRNNLKGVHTAESTSEVALIIDGTPLTIPKQPCQGGAGGNPLIWIQFLQGSGEAIGDPVFLGRCNQI